MLKRITSFLLALILTFGVLSPAAAFAEEEGSGEEQTQTDPVQEENDNPAEEEVETPQEELPLEEEEQNERQEEHQEDYQEDQPAFAIMPASDEVVSGTCGDGLTWTFDPSTGVMTVTGYGTMKDYKDPRDVYAYPSELAPWNSYAGQITEIVLDTNVTSVGDYAFSECSELKELTVPVSVKNIGRYAFRSSNKVTDIYYAGTDAEWATLKGNAETGNSPLFQDTVTVHTNWGERENTMSGTCGVGVMWVLDLDTGKMTISGTGKMQDYWGGHGDYQPEARYTPWNDVYRKIKSVVVEPGVTSIGMYAFANCTITEVTIPKTVTKVNHHAFKDNLKLSYVYYGGSEADWNALVPNVGSGNEYLLSAPNKYFAGGEADVRREVRYYVDWEESTQLAYFGCDADSYCIISEETSDEFCQDPDAYQGKYVLVESKAEGEKEILLRMILPETGYGTVTTVAADSITVGEKKISVSMDLSSLKDETVLYHIYNGELVGIEILQRENGYLTYVHESALLKIQSNEGSSDSAFYWCSDLMPSANGEFLAWAVWGALGSSMDRTSTDVYVNYLVDSNRRVYEIGPVVEKRSAGFSEKEHGWPIANHWWPFNYPDDYTFEPWVYFAHGQSVGALTMKGKHALFDWGGNCFGLSLLAVAHYNNQLDLKPYFDRTGETLNQFGYDSIVYKSKGQLYALYRFENGTPVVNEAIVRKIEMAQVAQVCDEIEDVTWKLKPNDYETFINYLSSDSPKPLLMTFAGHTIVTDTTMKPIYMGNGQYLIPMYDCKYPEAPQKINDLWLPYETHQTFVYLDTVTGTYGRYEEETLKTADPDSIASTGILITAVHKLDDEFFDGFYSFESEHTVKIVGTFGHIEIYSVESATGQATKVFEMIAGIPNLTLDGIEYLSYSEEDESGVVVQKGTIKLPLGNYIIKTSGESYIQCMYDNDIFVADSDSGVEIKLDTRLDEMTVTGIQDGAQISCVHASSEVDFCTTVEGSVGNGEYIALSVNTEEKTAVVETNLSSNAFTMSHAIDGELIDITPDMIHQHKDLTYKAAAEADCTHPGNVAHYVCPCGKTFADANACEEIMDVVISALGHTGQWLPTENEGEESRTCERCGETETRTTGNRLVMDAATLGDHTSVWVEGVEYPVETWDGRSVIRMPEGDSFHMTTYTFHVGDPSDIHTQYPTGMQVWKISKGEDGTFSAVLIPELNDILQYSGSSIRITGNKGIRMITSITRDNKKALTSGAGLGGYKLLEYGTVLCFASEMEGGNPLILGQEYARSNYAYKKDVADPVFAYSGNLMQYTNVLVGFNNDQCKADIAMRPYMILEDAEGSQVTIYGGTVYRSIGYIAWQNRTVFNPGTAAYGFVWDIIHYVYGDRYDEDYQSK